MTKKRCYFCGKKSKHCKGYMLDFAVDCPVASLYQRVYLCKECINEAIVDLLVGQSLIDYLEHSIDDTIDPTIPY